MNKQTVILKNLWTPTETIRQRIPKILSGVLMALQAILFIQLMRGIVNIGGKLFSLRTAIDFVLNILEFKNNSFLHALLGIFYIVVLILVIKNFIGSIKYLKAAFGKDVQESATAIAYVYDFAGRTFFLGTLFYVIVNYFARVTPNSASSSYFWIGAIVILAAKFVICLWESNDLWAAISSLGYSILIAVAIWLFMMLIEGNKFSDILPGFRRWIRGTESPWKSLYGRSLRSLFFKEALPVFYLLFHIFLLKVLNNFILLTDYRDVGMRRSVKVLFSASVIFIAVLAVVYGYEAKTVQLSSFRGLRNYLALPFTSLVMLLSFYFPSIVSEQPETVASAEEEKEEAVSAEETATESDDA